VPGVEKCRVHTVRQLQALVVGCLPAEIFQAVQHIQFGVEGDDVCLVIAASRGVARGAPCFLFLQVAGIEQHQPRQVARRGTGDDLAPETVVHEKGQAAAVVEVRMGEEQEIDACRIESERLSVLFVKLAASLEHPAVDQNPPACALDQVAGACDALVSAVK